MERLRFALRYVLFPFKQHIPPNAVSPREAVGAFLGNMAATAARTSPKWMTLLRTALDESSMSYDAKHAFFEAYPIEDYYFAGVVVLEASRLHGLYPLAEADAILGEIALQIDQAAGRRDRIVSEFVFDALARIDTARAAASDAMPYDLICKLMLQQLGLEDNELTRELVRDKGFRHALGEPLAMGVQHWWRNFQARFVLWLEPEEEPEAEDKKSPAPAPKVFGLRRKRATVIV